MQSTGATNPQAVPVQTPDLSALSQAGGATSAPSATPSTAPSASPVTSAPQPSEAEQAYQFAAEQYKRAADAANTPVATPAPVAHERLWQMVQGIGIGLSSGAKAMATHGTEGGAPEVEDFYAKQQAQKIAAQNALIEQKNADVQQKVMSAQSAEAMAHSYVLMQTVPLEMAKAHTDLDLANANVQAKRQEIAESKQRQAAGAFNLQTAQATQPDVIAAAHATAQKDVADAQTAMANAKTQPEKDKAALDYQRALTSETEARTNLTNMQAKQYLTDNTPNIFGDTGGVDAVTGMPLAPKAREARWTAFNQKTLQPLQTTTEKSWNMAQQAYREYKQADGNLPTGAQSMMLLSQHLSTTFGNVKGARVTKDMIAEHLGARSISDSALVAVQRLTNGDKLSPDQWEAFSDLISQSREYSYEAAIDNARTNGLGKTIPAWLPKAPARGNKIDAGTLAIYSYAAGGNVETAIKAAKAAGWSIQ